MLPNLPILHWWTNRGNKEKLKIDGKGRNCWKIPDILDLHFNNKYWQVKETKNGTFYLYAAYYDVRKAQRHIVIGENFTKKVYSFEPELRPVGASLQCEYWG